MANQKTIGRIIALMIIPSLISMLISGCQSGDNNRNAVYEDMKTDFEKSGMLSANIGLFSKSEHDGEIAYTNGGSGVIFYLHDGAYYALTAAHVVSTENSQLLVFTTNNEMKKDDIPGLDNMTLLSQEAYNSMYAAEVLYISTRDDLAVIRFSADENLSVIEMADSNPQNGERMMCIGNPQNEWFAVSYGTITSDIETFGELTEHPSNAMKHTAYMQTGSSGGAALNENMKLVGITPGASLSLDGKDFYYGVMIPVSEIEICLNEWKNNRM